MTITDAKPTPAPRLYGVQDPVVSVIKYKVLQEFIPQVPEIVTFIEKQYGLNTATAREYLQNKVGNVLAALSTPLLDEQRKRQRRIDALNEELVFVKDLYSRDVDATRHDVRKAVKETASLKAQNSEHNANLEALMRAFGLPTHGVKVANAWAKLKGSVDKLLQQRQEHETMKRQLELLQEKVKEKANQLNAATVEGEQKLLSERIARLSDELVAKRQELECYKTNAEHQIAALQQSVDQKNEQIETLSKSTQARIDRLTASDVSKQSRIDQLTENDVSKQSHIDRLTAEKQSLIDQLTAARDASVSMLGNARNDCTANVNQYTAQIDTLNKEINELRIELTECAEINDQTKTRLAEYSAIKTLYERVSESLEKAQAYCKVAVDYNEPVTNVILDVLAKVQAHASDFSSVKIPKATPLRPISADARVQTIQEPTRPPEDTGVSTTRQTDNDTETVTTEVNACTSRKFKRPAYTKRNRKFKRQPLPASSTEENRKRVISESDPDWTPGGKRRRPADARKTKRPGKADTRKTKRAGKSQPFDRDAFTKLFDQSPTPPSQLDTTSGANTVDDDDVATNDSKRPRTPIPILTFDDLVSPSPVVSSEDPLPPNLRDLFTCSDGNDTDTGSFCAFTVDYPSSPMTDFLRLVDNTG